MKFIKALLALILFAGLMGCDQKQTEPTDPKSQPILTESPAWAQDAIWYQIFVERFRNGDSTNDPRPRYMTGGDPEFIPESWSVTDWGHDWYEREPWIEDMKVDHFYHQIQARRFGGDLQGVLDKIDYIDDLGVTAIYFNPLNDAPSLHKYDARHWRHIDRTFGPDPEGDTEIIQAESPDNPSTWHWTAADSLFLKVIDAFHQRGIKVIMDYSWNHTGLDFWAIHDLREHGKDSKYTDWFNIHSYDDPATPANEFEYEGWAGYRFMPVVNKEIEPPTDSVMPFEGNLKSASLKKHIFNITRRWLDPNGDGDPSDGVDGFRLDVAAEVPMGFWRDYRKVVRDVNPHAYIVGEVWWLDWPSTLLDPRAFMGDQFDAIMNYRWYRIARGLFAQADPVLSPSEFVSEMKRINANIQPERLHAMMNVAATHDSPRLSTSIMNKTMYKHEAKPSDNEDYKIHKPGKRTRAEQKLLLVNQFTFPGSPHIWNGDEVGMWGADDPDCRKPMVWSDLDYEVEDAHYFPDQDRPIIDTVRPDMELLNYYKKLINLRKQHPVLANGELQFLATNDEQLTLAYQRMNEKDVVIVAFNIGKTASDITIPVENNTSYEQIFPEYNTTFTAQGNNLNFSLGKRSAVVVKRKK